MPMGNPMPVLIPSSTPGVSAQNVLRTPTGESAVVVDAHNLQGITIEQAIEGVSKAMPVSMSQEELMLRR